MKPILIDAIYINTGGALTVLNRLIDGAVKAGLNFILLKDKRCPKLNSERDIHNIIVLRPSLIERHKFYKRHKCDFHSVLCMGNVPPSVIMPCKVHTYFHNLSVLVPPNTYSAQLKFKFYLKRKIIQFLSKNTSTWIVQTWNTRDILQKSLKNSAKPTFIYPIYSIPESFKEIPSLNHRSEYLFIGDYTGAKGHEPLLDAWIKLHKRGINLTLNLTVSRRSMTELFCQKIDKAIAQGVPVKNHGFIPFYKVNELYGKCKVVIYPSQNESLGLGIVEGISAGCDVIAADLPYVHAICHPSEVFDCKNSDSIVDAVIKYEKGHSPKSELTIHDCTTELINFLKK